MADPRSEYRADQSANGRTDQFDEKKQWSIKDMPASARSAAADGADQNSQTIGEWLTDAIRAHAGKPALPSTPRARPVSQSNGRTDQTDQTAADLERLVNAAATLAGLDASRVPGIKMRALAALRAQVSRYVPEGDEPRKRPALGGPAEPEPAGGTDQLPDGRTNDGP